MSKRKVVQYTVTAVLLFQIVILAYVLLIRPKAPPQDARQETVQPTIFPDYKEITVPANIAPLNFRIEGEPEKCYARITGSGGGMIECFGQNKIQLDEEEWQLLRDRNRGQILTLTVYTYQDDHWMSWQPFTITVSSAPIDSHLVYRLIEPGYEKWHIVGLYQRDLTSFDETPIVRNDMTDYNCINCHSFCGGDPQQMMFHMRAANNGTYIVKGGNIQKLNTKTDRTISHMTYPYWHPSGRYITTSVNDIKQFFHAVKEKKMEVFDLASDVVVYDVEKKQILAAASLLTAEAFETFPSFSPDGNWLYFCSAPAAEMPENYDCLRYNLCRVSFDPAAGRIGVPVDTLVRADSLSATFPRLSPDGRFLMYTETAYGQFPIWHKDAEIRMIDLHTGAALDMSPLNSPDTDSYHSWSSNSRWVVISSRRENGLYTLPYLSCLNEQGIPSKPFLLPQEDPDSYDFQLYSYNIPELVTGPVTISPYAIQHAARKGQTEQVTIRE